MKDVGQRSSCPINLSIELVGDKWTLLVLRDIMFADRRHFRVLLAESVEGIASNILSDRLKWLTEHGLLTRSPDPAHRQKLLYSLTERSIDLVPVLVQLGVWGGLHTDADPAVVRTFRALDDQGSDGLRRLMDALRVKHICGDDDPPYDSDLARLHEEYDQSGT